VAKIMRCFCGSVIRGETDDDIVTNVQKHAREVHDMEVTKEQVLSMARQGRGALETLERPSLPLSPRDARDERCYCHGARRSIGLIYCRPTAAKSPVK
jgi:predicted small metal-binding protein